VDDPVIKKNIYKERKNALKLQWRIR